MKTACALIIDDEADIRELIAMTLSRMGLEFHTAANLNEARNLLDTYQFDLCLTDMKLPDGNGVEFVRQIHTTHPLLPVAVITAHGNMEAAVEAMKNGAYDFVSKPVDINQLRQLVVDAVATSKKSSVAANDHNNGASSGKTTQPASSDALSSQATQTPKPPQRIETVGAVNTGAANTGTQLIGTSNSIQELRHLIKKVSKTNAPIWITGESGTGKELVAKLIHESGPRCNNPFVAVNCGAIPANLMESELFGHKKGSFTGANCDHDGLFMQADNGTLFLDEVAELPLHMQVKLLRAIQERSIRPVGGNKESVVNVRILSASHMDLSQLVDAGKFRHDLYYRLNVIPLRSPSLRERASDIPLLTEHLLDKLKAHIGGQSISIDHAALEKLRRYSFPGNVRELENMLERACTMMDNNLIQADDILITERNTSQSGTTPLPIVDLPGFTAGLSTGFSTCTSANDRNRVDSRAKSDTGDISERDRLIAALNETRWNRKAAAEKLGLTYRQLRYRIQQLGIDKAS